MNLLPGTATLTIGGVEYKLQGNLRYHDENPVTRDYPITPQSITCSLRMTHRRESWIDRFFGNLRKPKKELQIERSSSMRRLRRLKYKRSHR